MAVSTEYLDRLRQCLAGTSNLYVLDLSWLLHRNHYSFREMGVNINGYMRPTGHIYGVLSSIRMIRSVDPDSCIIVTQDGVPVSRIDELSNSETGGYKDGREELEFNFYADIPYIKACACSLHKVFWAYHPTMECDDLMYALSRHAQEVGYVGKTFVYSGDNDLLQSIDDRTSVIRTKLSDRFDEIDNNRVMTDEKFTKKFHGIDTAHITNFRAICGDSSDHIAGIPRFPRDIAVKIARATEDISQGHNFTPETEKERKWVGVLAENREIVQRNYRVMKLTSDFEVPLSCPLVNKEKLVKVLKQFELRSFMNYLIREGVLNEKESI